MLGLNFNYCRLMRSSTCTFYQMTFKDEICIFFPSVIYRLAPLMDELLHASSVSFLSAGMDGPIAFV